MSLYYSWWLLLLLPLLLWLLYIIVITNYYYDSSYYHCHHYCEHVCVVNTCTCVRDMSKSMPFMYVHILRFTQLRHSVVSPGACLLIRELSELKLRMWKRDVEWIYFVSKLPVNSNWPEGKLHSLLLLLLSIILLLVFSFEGDRSSAWLFYSSLILWLLLVRPSSSVDPGSPCCIARQAAR